MLCTRHLTRDKRWIYHEEYRSWFSSWVRSVFMAFAGGIVRAGGIAEIKELVDGTPIAQKSIKYVCEYVW
jgi:hypothetical protein